MKYTLRRREDYVTFEFKSVLGKVLMTINGSKKPIVFVCSSELKIAKQVMKEWTKKGYKLIC